MKKLISLVLALALVLLCVGAAFAAVNDNVSVSISGIHEGDTLKLYQIAATTYNATTNQLDWTWNGGLTAADFGFTDENYTFTQNSDGQHAALNAYNTLKNTTAVTAVANASGVATASVAPGYYVAFVEGSAASGTVYQRMLINAIQTVDTDSNTYVAHEAISAAVKKEDITITKTEDASATDNTQVTTTDGYHIGDDIHFTLTSSIPSYPSDSTYANFIITDTPTGLDDKENTVTVTVGGHSVTAGASTYTVAATTKGFTVTFEKAFILGHPAEEVIVEYDATLEGPVNENGYTENTATITYNPNPSIDSNVTPPGPDTNQHIYGLYIFKYKDGTDPKVALPGATFVLKSADTDGDTDIIRGPSVTDENGYISWTGLKNGTYYIEETAAPAGYRLDASRRAITLNSTTATLDDPTTDSVTETYFNKAEIPNTEGTTLPSTGGIGTTIFYIVGGILLVGAAIILVSRRKAHE
jgi:fimbrial isopeptide formation D2 family protein/LPXTG-motif cell wall-anchored protein